MAFTVWVFVVPVGAEVAFREASRWFSLEPVGHVRKGSVFRATPPSRRQWHCGFSSSHGTHTTELTTASARSPEQEPGVTAAAAASSGMFCVFRRGSAVGGSSVVCGFQLLCPRSLRLSPSPSANTCWQLSVRTHSVSSFVTPSKDIRVDWIHPIRTSDGSCRVPDRLIFEELSPPSPHVVRIGSDGAPLPRPQWRPWDPPEPLALVDGIPAVGGPNSSPTDLVESARRAAADAVARAQKAMKSSGGKRRSVHRTPLAWPRRRFQQVVEEQDAGQPGERCRASRGVVAPAAGASHKLEPFTLQHKSPLR
ncbi:hypothetical protein DFJ73DRAFT_244676 [Zopfochytrium polystomum]|nr:hypothetical protein DFJ73DRAFT_244676 [Zopfochytrium polystomum]